jgi:hypothetical protein
MKIMVVFYIFHVCPWLQVKICFPIFQESFEIEDGHQRSHDHPIEKNFQFFFHIAISVGHAMEVKKVS